MKLRSLGHRTDLIFTKLDGEVLDRGSHLVVRTHSNPNYFWGNLLIFDRPPRGGDFENWAKTFDAEFADPGIYHKTFAWDRIDGEQGDVTEFLAHGYILEKGVVLTAKEVHLPQKNHPTVEVRPIEGQKEWEASIQVQIACGGEHLSKKQWEDFYRSQMDRYKKLVSLGQGFWFGAFVDGKVVGGLGLFTEGEIARYQSVCTHPNYQRKGICGSLVFHSAQYAFEKMKVKTLVMVADEEYHAAKVYESVGFRPTEKIRGLSWWDKSRV